MSSATITPELRADVLVEAIPYLARFAGSRIVVKYGGNALADADEESALRSFADDVLALRSVGVLPVVVHGGGPQIGEMMQRLGMEPEFRDGLRVTDGATLDVARMVLVGKVNREIVGAINAKRAIAVGLSGEDAGLIGAIRRVPDIGFVGDVDVVDTTILDHLLLGGFIPVVATIGSDGEGQAYNINADTVAGALARALSAEKLIFLTDVSGIRADREDPGSVVSSLGSADLENLIADGIVNAGMIPKAQACAEAVRGGVGSAHILDGRVAHALLVELFSETGIGTMVVDQ
jgi:acetylglutamate kinase